MRDLYSSAAERDFVSAADYFEHVRAASRSCESATRQLAALQEGWRPGGMTQPVSGGMATDKSGAIVSRMVMADRLRERITRAEAVMDEASEVIYGRDGRGGLASLMGSEVADLVWWRFLDNGSWTGIAASIGRSARWCQYKVESAVDYVDAHGLTDVTLGEGHAV